MSFTYDFNKVQEPERKEFRLLDDGEYTFFIKAVEEATSQAGNPMAKVTASVAYGPSKGTLVWHNVTFLPPEAKGAFFAKKFLKAIGQPHKGNISVNVLAWAGKQFLGTVETEEWNGKKRNKLTDYKPVEAKAVEDGPEAVLVTTVKEDEPPF